VLTGQTDRGPLFLHMLFFCRLLGAALMRVGCCGSGAGGGGGAVSDAGVTEPPPNRKLVEDRAEEPSGSCSFCVVAVTPSVGRVHR